MVLVFEGEFFLKNINIQTAQWVRAACSTNPSAAGRATLACFDFASSRDQTHPLQWNMAYAQDQEKTHTLVLH